VTLWDEREPLTAAEREQIKRHPSLAELVLARSMALGQFGTLAGLHRGQGRLSLDGTRHAHGRVRGYPADWQAGRD
jgi:hypothetical protein